MDVDEKYNHTVEYYLKIKDRWRFNQIRNLSASQAIRYRLLVKELFGRSAFTN